MADVRILILSKDALSRAALAALLARSPGMDVVGQVSEGDNPADQAELFHPDVILLDISSVSPETQELIRTLQPIAPVLALLSGPEDFAAAWEAGVQGSLLRDVSPQALTSALVATANGNLVLDPGLIDQISGRIAPDGPPSLDPLSPREKEVLLLLAEGLPNKAIAARLSISDHTVKFHVNAILRKLGAQSRTEAVVLAARSGLIPV